MDRISKLNAEVMKYYQLLLEKKGKEAKLYLNRIIIPIIDDIFAKLINQRRLYGETKSGKNYQSNLI